MRDPSKKHSGWRILASVVGGFFTVTGASTLAEDLAAWGVLLSWVDADAARWGLVVGGFLLIAVANAPAILTRVREARGDPEASAVPRPHATRVEPPRQSNELTVEPHELTAGAIRAIESDPVSEKETAARRVWVDVSPEYLSGFFRDHMAIQAEKLIEPYIGTWMKVSGVVEDVEGWDGDLAYVRLQVPGPALHLHFTDEQWVDRLAVLRRGEQITVAGQVSDVGLVYVFLMDCELVTGPIAQ